MTVACKRNHLKIFKMSKPFAIFTPVDNDLEKLRKGKNSETDRTKAALDWSTNHPLDGSLAGFV